MIYNVHYDDPVGEANEFTMDSLDGFQPERDGRAAEVDRKAEEEQKVKVMVILMDWLMAGLF